MFSNSRTSIAGITLIAASLAAALSKWYVVWLAQKVGGPATVGVYGLLIAVATPSFVVAQLGLRNIALTMSSPPKWSVFVICRAAGLVIGCLSLLVLIWINPNISWSLGLAVLLMKVFDSIVDLDYAKIQIGGRINLMSFIALGGALLSIFGSTIFILANGTITSAVLGAAFGSAATALIARFFASKVTFEGVNLQSPYLRVARASLPLTAAQLLAATLISLPTIVLGFSSDLHVVGLFVAVSYLIIVADLVGSSIAKVAISPFRVAYSSGGIDALKTKSNKLALLVLLVGVPASLLVVFFGPWIFSFIYGPDFFVPRDFLAVLSIGGVAMVFSHIQTTFMYILNNYSLVTLTYLISTVVALSIGVILLDSEVPGLMIGAIIATSGSVTRSLILIGSIRHLQKVSSGSTGISN